METDQAKSKLERYCAYQDRSVFEAEEKLKGYGLGAKQIKGILAELMREGFLDENRFSINYAKGKFRNNKWGKIKIKQHLLQKRVPKVLVEKGLNEIPHDEYLEMISMLIDQKSRLIDEPDAFVKNNKIAAFLIRKGFEPDLVWDVLKETGPL
jgi:regulatory protein